MIMEKRQRNIILAIGVTSILGLSTILMVTQLTQQYKDPIPSNSTLIKDWTCENGKAWLFGHDKMVAVCKDMYIDFREVLDDKVTIKGLTLNIQEWDDLLSTISTVDHYRRM